jgi:3-hydroxy-9,10-secoandrosta-1,3,5(10)-triene-9,17-dione monooxygenase reductase component
VTSVMIGSISRTSHSLGNALFTVPRDLLRRAFASFPTGVVILSTITLDERKVGLTVSSFNSVSVSPPLILWSISKTTPSFTAFRDTAYFCVNVLCERQIEIARHFARPSVDKFATIRHVVHETHVPIVEECAAYLVCRMWRQYDGGDHLIIVGEVVDVGTSDEIPLVFGLGRYGRLALDQTSRT